MQFDHESDMIIWAANLFNKVVLFYNLSEPLKTFQGAKNQLKRFSKEPIYIHVESEVYDYDPLSGKYNFHSIKNKTAVFMREGGKLETFSDPTYYFTYHKPRWYLQSGKYFDQSKEGGWMRLRTTGYYHYFL